MNAKSFLIVLIILVTLLIVVYFYRPSHSRQEEWREYLGGPERNHYSTLTQINLSNVSQLQKAWEYHTRDSGQVQCNPIIVNGRLYGVTATAEPFALDAATGRQIWKSYTIPERPRPLRVNSAGTQLYGPAGAAVWNHPSSDAL